MTIIFKTESWRTLWPEMKEIWEKEHRAEVHPKEVIDGEIDDKAYMTLDLQRKLVIVTVREDVTLVGYSVFFINQYINFKSVRCGMSALYYIRKPWRGQGLGKRLIQISEQQLKLRGVQCFMVSVKTELGFQPMFEHFGYKAHETLMMKWT